MAYASSRGKLTKSEHGDGAADAYAKAGSKQPEERNGKRRKSSTFDTTLAPAVIATVKFNKKARKTKCLQTESCQLQLRSQGSSQVTEKGCA